MLRKVSLGVALMMAASLPLVTSAATIQVGNDATLAGGKTAGNAYIAGRTISSVSNISGELVAAGGSMVINGSVGGDLLAGGGNIAVLSPVGGNVRIGGGNIVLQGTVKGDVLAAGGNTQISGGGIGGDLIWAGGGLRLEAPVAGNLTLRGGNVFINSKIVGNVKFTGNKLTLGNAAVIGGNLTYSAPKKVEMQQGSIVRGAIDYQPSAAPIAPGAGGIIALAILAALAKFLVSAVAALALGLFFNRYALAVVEGVADEPWPSLGRGFVTFIVLPVASVILLLTVIGVSLGALGLVAFVALIIYGSIMAAILTGSFLSHWFQKSPYRVTWQTIILGAFAYALLGLIPFIGPLIKFLIALLAIGAGVKIKWDIAKTWR